MGDDALEHLAALSDLRSLKLDGTKITDGLLHLKAFKKLESLTVPGSAATDTGLSQVANLHVLGKPARETAP